jgi:predicted metal-dependent phosphoesterase TrpH
MSALPPISSWTRLDLHMHSNLSDGRYSPNAVLERAAKGALDVIALTDHDLPSGLPQGRVTVNGHPLYVLHGAEISGHYQGVEQHLLVYFPGPMPQHFADFCRELAAKRAHRYERAVHNLAIEGLPAPDDAAWQGERSLTRLHLSQALVDAGHAESLHDAFARFTGRSTGNVPNVELSFVDAIKHARAAGGITSWAHPALDNVRKWLPDLAAAGLQGVEVFRPPVGGKTRRELGRLARKQGLVLTGGSDWHGWRHHQLGEFAVLGQQTLAFNKALAA